MTKIEDEVISRIDNQFPGSWRITRTGKYFTFEVKRQKDGEIFWPCLDKHKDLNELLSRVFRSRYCFFDGSKHVVDEWEKNDED